MKIVLSRKGFDLSNGGVPSPILPDGRLLSLPIPHVSDDASYATTDQDIAAFDDSVAQILNELRPQQAWNDIRAHLDPDLRHEALARTAGWRPLFGQDAAAQGHLRSNDVGPGDLFLFFGWFRETRRVGGKLEYVPNAPHLHVLFGWLHVGEVWPEPHRIASVPEYARYHAHARTDYGPSNTLYAAVGPKSRHGAGVFRRYAPILRLTAPDASERSVWQLPSWFYPTTPKPPLTYHGDLSRWSRSRRHVNLTVVDKGQEFILDTDHYPEAHGWVDELLAAA